MAKKIEKFDDRLDIDSGLDFPDFEFEDFDVKDDRKPIVKAAAGALDGAVAGLKDSSFIRQSIKDILPRGYGQSMDLADNISDSMRSIVRDAGAEMRPALAEIKKTATKLIPTESKLVPKSVQSLLQRWREETTTQVANQSMQRDAVVSAQLSEIFGAVMQQNTEQAAKEEGNTRLQEGIELSRHRDTTDLQSQSLAALKSIDQYNRKINLPVQKKTLELMHQQLFMQQDTLSYMQQSNKRRDDLLATINKNTALPDFVKINKKENLHQIVRNKFYDSANNGLFGDRNQAVQKITTGIRDRVMSATTGAVQGIRTGLSGADQMNDAVSGDQPGVDKYQVGGSIAGGVGAQWLGSKIGFGIRDKIQGSWLDRKLGIIDKGNDLESGISTLPHKINSFRKDSTWDFDDSLKGRTMKLLQALVPGMQADMSVDRVNVRSLDDPTSFSKKTDRSINEVIPGFLSRILREVQILRTGEESIELTEFDAIKGKFTGKGKNDLNSFRSIFNPRDVKGTQDRLTDLEKFIDADDKLSPEAKTALRKTLLKNSANLNESNAKSLGQKGSYPGASDEVTEQITEHMKAFFDQMSSEQKVVFSRMNAGLINDIGESRGAIQQQLNLGRAGQLEKHGLLSADGRSISLDGILEQYLDPKNAQGPVEALPEQDTRLVEALEGFAGGLKNKYQSTKQQLLGRVDHYKQLGWNGSMDEVGGQLESGLTTVSDKVKEGLVGAQAKLEPGLSAVANSERFKNLKTSWTQAQGEVGNQWAQMRNYRPTAFDPYTFQNTGTQDPSAEGPTPAASPPPWVSTIQAGLTQLTNEYSAVVPGAIDSAVGKVKETDRAIRKVIKPDLTAPATQDAPADIYVQGEDEPRLRAALMAAGEYSDRETGEPINTPEDIKGDVIDSGQRILLSGTEIPTLMTFSERIGRFVPLRLLGALSNPVMWLAKKAWHFQTKIAPKMVAFNYKLTKKAFNAAGRMARSVLGMNPAKPNDVYINGEAEPRLLGVKIAAGNYRHKHTNAVLTHESKIEGTIIDQDNEIVIDESELDQLQVYSSVFKVYNPLKLIPKAMRGIGRLLKGFQTKIAPKMVAFNAKLVRGAGSLITRALGLGPVDVYVKGNGKAALLGKQMADGEYFSRVTGKPIKTPGDIDGAVTDSKGEIVLSEQDLETGITRADGKPLVSRFFKGVKNAMGKIGRFFSVRTGLKLKSPKNEISEKLGEDLNKISPLKGGFLKQTPDQQQVSLLQTLVNLTQQERIDRAKEKLLGPDGERLNSFKSKFKKKKKDKEASTEKKKDKEGNLFGGLGKMFGGLFGKKKDGEEGAGGVLGSIASLFSKSPIAATATTIAAGTGAVSAAGTAAGAVGAAGSALAATSTAATVGTALAAAGTGILSFLASPIVLGAAALALGGYGVYRGYKYLTRGNMQPIEKIRYVQYGFRLTEPKHAAKVLALEKALLPYLKLDGNTPSIDEKAIKIEELMDPFDLDTGDKSEVQLFFRWYQNRFKPVFLTHAVVIQNLKGKADISLANSLKGEELKSYIEATRFSNGPYRVMDLPLLEKDLKASSAGDVEDAINECLETLAKASTQETKTTEKAPIAFKPDLPKEGLQTVAFKPGVDQPGPTVGQFDTLSPNKPLALVSPDAEAPVTGSVADVSAGGDSSSNQPLQMAPGSLSDGRNGRSFIHLKDGVNIDRLNPAMLKNFYAMADEYGAATGKKITVNDGYRSYEEQVAMKKKHGAGAATPGHSMHGFGLALDINGAKLDELEKMGLMRKYGFTRPVGGEPWHMEPAGIQGNIDGYKKSPEAAMQAIERGVGLGGGGNALVANARKYGRNRALALSLLAREVKPNVEPAAQPEVVMASIKPQGGVGAPTASVVPTTTAGGGIQTVGYTPPDAEAPVKASAPTGPAMVGTTSGPMNAPTAGNTWNARGARPTDIQNTVGLGGSSAEIKPSGAASDVPQVKGAGYQNVKETINAAARVVGYDADRLTKVIAVESGFNPTASAGPKGAQGLGQFLGGTWDETTGKYGKKYGVNATTSRHDGRANALMTAHYLKDGEKILKASISRPITAVDNYFAHFLGPYGAKKFLAAVQSSPSTIGATLMPAAAANNRGIFYSNGAPRTVLEIYQEVSNRINNKIKSFGIKPEDTAAVTAAPSGAGGGGDGSIPAATMSSIKDFYAKPENGFKTTTPSNGDIYSSPENQDTDNPDNPENRRADPAMRKHIAESGLYAKPKVQDGGRATVVPNYSGQAKTSLAGLSPTMSGAAQPLPKTAPRDNPVVSNLPMAPRPLNPVQPSFNPTNNVIKIDGSVFGTTEKLLGESLEVHKQVLGVLQQMLGAKDQTKAPASTTAPTAPTKTPEAAPLKVPSGTINMRRMV